MAAPQESYLRTLAREAGEACPFPDELQGAGIEAAGEYLAVHRYRGTPPGMVGVEVGHRVIALVPVHVDHDP